MERAYNICIEMLEQRNYEIISREEQIIALKPDGEQIIVFFADTIKFNVQNIQIYINMMHNLEINHCIIVYNGTITPFAKKAILQSTEMTFELFSVDDLQINITKHILQPKFQLLTNNETDKMTQQYLLKFGTLKKEDPICRFYNFQKGNIIKIIRSNNCITYRIVK